MRTNTTIALVALASLAFAAPLQARLHETAEECIARYGQPEQIDKENRTLIFSKNGYFLMAIFDAEEHCEAIVFKRLDEATMSDTEIDILLEANLGAETKKSYTGITPVWKNPAGDQGQYEWTDETLTLVTKAYIKAENAKKRAKEQEALDGF